MFFCRFFALCLIVVFFQSGNASANSASSDFREYDVNFLSYGVRHSSFTTDKTYELRHWYHDTIESLEYSTHTSSMVELAASYSFQLFEIGSFAALRLEPELRAALSSSGSQFGGSLPLRLQFGAMSAEQNYDRWGVGLKVGFATMLLPEIVEEAQEPIYTGLQYWLIISGVKFGTSTLSFEVGITQFAVEERTLKSYEDIAYDINVLTIGATMSGFDL